MEGTLMNDYQLTVAVRTDSELIGASERVLDLLVAKHESLGPITGVDLEDQTILVTIAYDADDLGLDEAVRRGTDVIAAAFREAGVEIAEVLDAHLTRIPDPELQPA
ncbi:MAG: hypothetical protein ACXWDT_05785 [Solirubrobacterales bacterium]